MCRPVKCRQCGNTTWAGCGLHVEQVMAGVPKDQRCPGHDDAPSGGGGLLGRLRRRRAA